MLFIVHHTAGEFIVRTERTKFEAAELLGEKWGIDIVEMDEATPEDIKINEGQITELDTDL